MMKSIIVIGLLAIVTVLSGPTPPSLPQQFTTNFTVILTDFVTKNDKGRFEGFFALDYKNGGARLEIGGEEYIPLSFHTNFIATPNDTDGTVTGYMYEGELCWNAGSVSKSWLIFFPFQLPDNSTYAGDKVVNGVDCQHWWFNAYDEDYRVDVYVTKDDIPVIERIILNDIPYSGPIQFDFLSTQPGPFDPSIYSPPNVQYDLECNPVNYQTKRGYLPSVLRLLINH
eukprot:TRINITY_DN440_c0_g1_i1.p1 TRINITY_DN440_c0_g1~~TRINITY_DN440_c0_g1_i1.p1  ORF type:complete len:240 (-),score=56.54 TRINITY_DN440_c0_g1_i1:17-697(-)